MQEQYLNKQTFVGDPVGVKAVWMRSLDEFNFYMLISFNDTAHILKFPFIKKWITFRHHNHSFIIPFNLYCFSSLPASHSIMSLIIQSATIRIVIDQIVRLISLLESRLSFDVNCNEFPTVADMDRSNVHIDQGTFKLVIYRLKQGLTIN